MSETFKEIFKFIKHACLKYFFAFTCLFFLKNIEKKLVSCTKKRSLPLKIFLANVNRYAENCEFVHIYKINPELKTLFLCNGRYRYLTCFPHVRQHGNRCSKSKLETIEYCPECSDEFIET